MLLLLALYASGERTFTGRGFLAGGIAMILIGIWLLVAPRLWPRSTTIQPNRVGAVAMLVIGLLFMTVVVIAWVQHGELN